jgi:transposase
MMKIPTEANETQFQQHIEPPLTKAKRGYVSEQPLYKIFNLIRHKLYTGCQWPKLPMERDKHDQPVMSYQVPYYHFRKWSRDGSLQRLFDASIMTIEGELNLSELNLDGSHSAAKKGGEAVAYQGRKKAKTSNILPVTDAHGNIIATTGIVAGNHNDSYELEQKLRNLFNDMKRCRLAYRGAIFNMDSSFDTRAARKLLWNRGVKPNIVENRRNRKTVKRGRKRYFNPVVYKHRFVSERSFAWIDKFKTLLIRFERKAAYCFGFHLLAFALINLRGVFAKV